MKARQELTHLHKCCVRRTEKWFIRRIEKWFFTLTLSQPGVELKVAAFTGSPVEPSLSYGPSQSADICGIYW